MMKKYDEALSNMQRRQILDSERGCHVFKLLKDEDYDEPSADGSKGESTKMNREPSKKKLSKPSKKKSPKGQPPKEGISKEEPPKEDTSKEEPPKEDTSKEEPPKEKTFKEEPSKEKPPKKEPPKKKPLKKESSKEEPSKEESSMELPCMEDPCEEETCKAKSVKRKVHKRKKKITTSTVEAVEEEILEYHKMSLINDNLPSKDTQVNYKSDLKKRKVKKVITKVKEVPPPPPPVEEPVKEIVPPPPVEEPVEEKETDLVESFAQDKFRDGIRRIDIVLVAADDGKFEVIEERNKYLESILKAGLHIETSPGVMSMNRNLIFIKIHAPNSVLDEYNHAFGTKKYFRDDHLRFVQPGLTYYGQWLRFARVAHERELISLVRDQYEEPLRLSNAERSLIVYKILLELPYGLCYDNFGLDRLLWRRIFLDAYALHDGPHFIFPNQDWKTINARQYLFYNWVGKINAYKVNPLNLIREYFGERVGMFFAFYEFFNHSLMIISIIGVIMYILAVFNTTDRFIVDDICKNKNKSYMCPRCNVFDACRFIKFTDLCKQAKIHKVLDSPINIYYATCLTIWAITFYILWRRKENFWKWLWEINTNQTLETYKPEHSFDATILPRTKLTGILRDHSCTAEKEVRTFLVVTLWIFLFTVPILMVVQFFLHKQNTDINLIKDKVVSLRNEEIVFVVIFAIELQIFQILAELGYGVLIYYITKFVENHRTYESQARSIMFKTFMTSFLWTFPVLFYYAWIKGAEFFTPVKPYHHNKTRLFAQFRGRYTFTHCGPFTCIDEVFFVLLATILIRHIAIPFSMFLKGLIYNTMTDYNQGARVNKNVPCWEREFRLEPVTEIMMARKVNVLVMQFALVTLVGVVFPLAPLLILIRNFCDIRYEARMFVQCRRRPLLLGTGLGVWTPILQRLAYSSCASNALTIAITTKTVARNLYMKKKGSMKGYLFDSLYLADTKIYTEYLRDATRGMLVMWNAFNAHKKKNFVPNKCFFPGYFGLYKTITRETFKKDYSFFDFIERVYMPPMNITMRTEFHTVSCTKNIYYVIFLMAGVLYAALLNHAVPSYSNQMKNIMVLETGMKNAYIRKAKM